MVKRNAHSLSIIFVLMMSLGACSPEVGSKSWCKEMDKKAKMDWTTRELKDYAKHCLDQ